MLRQVAPAWFIDRGAEVALAERSVEQFRIRASSVEQVAEKLSGGNQQKVVLGKWLATKPRVLIMDEPTRGIDVGAKSEIHRLMSELAQQGLAILMISSELPEIMGMSDRILVMRGGTIVADLRARRGDPGDDRDRHDERIGRRRARGPTRTDGGLAGMAVAARLGGAQDGFRGGLRRIFGSQEMILLLSIVALLVVVGAINPRFVAERNLQSIFLGNAYIAVAAIGMSMVIISGNIDISVGSLIGVLATLSGTLAVAGFPLDRAAGWHPLVVGAMVTALMGFLVAYLRIPAIVVSLGMLSILKGGLISVTGGAWISKLPEGFALAQMRPLGIPMPI